MSTFYRETLSTREFTEALRAAADLLDTDAVDGVKVLDDRHCPEQGETLTLIAASEEAVHAFAKRHGVKVEEHQGDDTGRHIWADLGFGRGVSHDDPYGPPDVYQHAFILSVRHIFPGAGS